MIDKQPNGSPDSARVTFRLPEIVAVREANVVGEFNDWSREAHAMERRDGSFVVEVELPVGRAYRFRYLLDGERWENDWAADGYQHNEHGGDDSVVDLTAPLLDGQGRPISSSSSSAS